MNPLTGNAKKSRQVPTKKQLTGRPVLQQMRTSHANLHLDTNATLTDTCVRQKVQAAITARQGKTCPFKHSERSLEIFYQTNDIYYKVCTRHLVDKLLNQFLRETPFDISRGDLNDQQSCRQSPPTTCLLTSNYNVSRFA